MKSGKKRMNSKKSAVIALCVVLALTILFGVLGFTGLKFPPRGLHKLLSWLPTSDSDNWPESLRLGLDLQGGMYVEYEVTAPDDFEGDFGTALSRTIDVLQLRLTDGGHAEATVQELGTSGIRVEIPTKKGDKADYESILALIGGTGKLEFRTAAGETFMTGDMVKTAAYQYDPNADGGPHLIAFELTSEGAELFARETAKRAALPAGDPDKAIAIYLDGELLINPNVQSAITSGTGTITGMGTKERAQRIATQIQSGALPLNLRLDKDDTVSPTLGKDALSTSVTAAFIGILLIMALMIFRYRLNGVVASWALTIYIILLFFLIAFLGVELTLPGLAGVVLGIGMAVDANVIIFERFNEEARKGKSAKQAARAGFKNALSAILDANVTTLIAAIVLLIKGTGSIQGFAKTLMLGVIVSMISAVLVTRFLMNRFIAAGCSDMKFFVKLKSDKEVAE